MSLSFFSYLLKLLHIKEREERLEEIMVRCRYRFTGTEPNSDFREGTIVSLSNKGIGVVTAPPLPDEMIVQVKKKPIPVYVEYASLNTGVQEKVSGEIRWIKNIVNVEKPFSEMGIHLTGVEESTKADVLDCLFSPESENDQ
jgi:hypothetical protein